MTPPRVSVVVIFLDAGRFLEEAIESVVAQSYEGWELLLVDDGSTDGSSELARGWAERMPGKVRYLEHPEHENRGMSASRNLGIRHARGEYVALLDGDDVWLPDKLERQVAVLDSQPEAAMVYGKSRYWWSWTGEQADQRPDRVQEHGIEGDRLVAPPALLIWFLTGRAAVPPPSSVLVRRRAVEEVGGFEDGFRGLYEDQAFYAKLVLEHSTFVAQDCLDNYRQHPESICSTSKGSEQELAARKVFLEWLRDYLAARQAGHQALWAALGMELWLVARPRILPPRLHGFLRWIKKWILRLEQRLLPRALRRRLWSRPRASAGERTAFPLR